MKAKAKAKKKLHLWPLHRSLCSPFFSATIDSTSLAVALGTISFHLERVRKQKQIDHIKCVQSAVRNNEEYRARTGHNFEVRNCLQEVNEGLV